MHKLLPNLFVFLDRHNNKVFENNNTNMGIIYRNYDDPKRETELINDLKERTGLPIQAVKIDKVDDTPYLF